MRRFLRENSLSLFFLVLLLVTVVGQSFVGQYDYNAEQVEHGAQAMAVFTIYLRQRGSPESKPVGAPHSETGTSG